MSLKSVARSVVADLTAEEGVRRLLGTVSSIVVGYAVGLSYSLIASFLWAWLAAIIALCAGLLAGTIAGCYMGRDGYDHAVNACAAVKGLFRRIKGD